MEKMPAKTICIQLTMNEEDHDLLQRLGNSIPGISVDDHVAIAAKTYLRKAWNAGHFGVTV